MKRNYNICKFVSDTNNTGLIIKNFVSENNVSCDEMVVPSNNTISIVTSGKGKLCTSRFKNNLEKGSVFFTFSGTPFTIESVDNLQYIYITFSGERADALFKRFDISSVSPVFYGYENLISFWQSSIVKANAENLDLISEGVLLYTLSQLSPPTTSNEKALTNEILKYIENNFTDSTLSLTSVSKEMGYNSKYISRIFKESVGITFSEHLKNTRINHSLFLIGQGITSIKNIALLSGYHDPFYFSNIFKEEVGISPSEYIKIKSK